MAKIQTKSDRAVIFIKRKITAYLSGLSAKSLYGRKHGPKVIVNSLPKSGTNLLDRTMQNFPYMRSTGSRTLRLWGEPDNKLLRNILNIKPGQYLTAHMQENNKIFEIMRENNILGLMMIRDPRQIIISHYKYVTYIDTNHRTHKAFINMKNDTERLNAVINGVDDIVAPIDEVLNRFHGWVNNQNTFIVRFEDLIGEKGGGTRMAQRGLLIDIAKHLNLSINEHDLERIAAHTFSTKSPTFRSGKLDGWKNELNDKQKDIIKEKIGYWLIEFGYEKNIKW